jgi:mRNA interferase ChpB
VATTKRLKMARGDIVEINLDPTLGHEQKGRRRVLILSPTAFNQRAGIALVAPITQGGDWARDQGFSVPLTGTGLDTQGVVLWHQITSKDLAEREPRMIEQAPSYLVEEVLARAKTLLES